MDIVYAKTEAQLPTEWGGLRYIPLGSHWRANDPVVLANPDLFTSDPAVGLMSSTPEVTAPRVFVGPAEDAETATAAPGEKRYARRPRSGE